MSILGASPWTSVALPRTIYGIPSRSEFWDMYAFKERVGSGMYGEVWRCVERDSARVFACKEMEVKLPSHWSRITNEIECMWALRGCGHVAQIHDVHREGDSVYVVMEFCNGGDLFAEISASNTGLPEEASRRIFRHVAEGLAACHAEGFIHRDIKPENVLLHREEGQDCRFPSAKLADFGQARRPSGTSGTVRGRCGSPSYSAPEVAEGREYSYSADVWSLGILLYTMLAASWPETDKSGAVLMGDSWNSLSLEVQDLLARMLLRDPGCRPPIGEVLRHPWLGLHC